MEQTAEEFVDFEPVVYFCRWPGSVVKEKKPYSASMVTFIFGKYAVGCLLTGSVNRDCLLSWYDGLRKRGVKRLFIFRHGRWKTKKL